MSYKVYSLWIDRKTFQGNQIPDSIVTVQETDRLFSDVDPGVNRPNDPKYTLANWYSEDMCTELELDLLVSE